MMDASFIEEIRDGARTPMDIGARLFIPQGWSEAQKPVSVAAALVVHTLTGLVDYCQANRDGLELTKCAVHVKAPDVVDLLGPLENEETRFRRLHYAQAVASLVPKPPFPFGQYVDAETFYIGLQTGFVAGGDRGDLLKIVASIRENSVRETVDSGVAQEVKTGRGAVLVGTTAVPNPVSLTPYRTFLEVEQPASLFVLRLKENPNGDRPLVALFEADGGRWRMEAIGAVRAVLRAALPPALAVLA